MTPPTTRLLQKSLKKNVYSTPENVSFKMSPHTKRLLQTSLQNVCITVLNKMSPQN